MFTRTYLQYTPIPIQSHKPAAPMFVISQPARLLQSVKRLGFEANMDDYEKRKLSVFNQLNATGVICGLLIPIIGMFDEQHLPWVAYFVALSPAIISSIVLYLNFRKKFQTALITYFSLYPVVTSLVYAAGLNLGIELFFILYGVLSVFYMRSLRNGVIAFTLSATGYLIVFVFMDAQMFTYQLKAASLAFYVLNHLVALVFIFFALYWLKKENNIYQKTLLDKSTALLAKTVEIEAQKNTIAAKAEELAELNLLKNKLFSVISHDLKNPIYALRNLFRQAQRFNLPAEELKAMLPDIVNDLNYTTSLMDNLLQWAKTQMQTDAVQMQRVDVADLVIENLHLLRLQAEVKKIIIHSKLDEPLYVSADRQMLNLVLRNLLSNAIKFTPEGGTVLVEACDFDSFIEISISDTGVGMSKTTMEKLNANDFYTTTGTSNETGTGLGLMLCKEFLAKIGSRMYIESEEAKGSIFSFTLCKEAADVNYVSEKKAAAA